MSFLCLVDGAENREKVLPSGRQNSSEILPRDGLNNQSNPIR
jgi:hypothetical protein